MRVAIIGAGQRGTLYAEYMNGMDVSIVAVVETNEERRTRLTERYQIEHAFSSLDEFLLAEIFADAVVVATPDRTHYECSIRLLNAGYHLLLEKPISESSEECVEIMRLAESLDLEVIVCHVLRYTNFFSTIKEIVQSERLGKIVTIEYAEYMGNFHMAHSFVRGKWRNSLESSPIFLQKSCHDMDILYWLADSDARWISSSGSISYFKESNAPAGSSERCSDCPHSSTCPFDAERTYIPMVGKWRSVDVTDGTTEADMRAALQDGPYGRCVFRCDNDVCDHQVASIEFESGVTATFQMSGFSDRIHRRIKVMCEQGDIEGDDSENYISVKTYGTFDTVPTKAERIELPPYIGRHGGGDYGLVEDFVRIIRNRLSNSEAMESSRSSIANSVQSHFMANAAEASRKSHQTIDLQEYIHHTIEKQKD